MIRTRIPLKLDLKNRFLVVGPVTCGDVELVQRRCVSRMGGVLRVAGAKVFTVQRFRGGQTASPSLAGDCMDGWVLTSSRIR